MKAINPQSPPLVISFSKASSLKDSKTSKLCHYLGTKYSNPWAWGGGHISFEQQQITSMLYKHMTLVVLKSYLKHWVIKEENVKQMIGNQIQSKSVS